MCRFTRLLVLIAGVAALTAAGPSGALAQAGRPASAAQHRPVARGNVVFVGGYFYDPFFGPYPWWGRGVYPYHYFPVFDDTAIVRVVATPKDAAVYVDGFYAGTVHDFNDWFQGLPLSPGGHEILLYLEGFQTVKERIYLRPASSIKLELTLVRLDPGQTSEPPAIAPAVPVPPDGSFTPPHTPRGPLPIGPCPPTLSPDVAIGTLSLQVQPPDAEVVIDRDRWTSSDGIHFVIDLTAGVHHLEIASRGHRPYVTDIQLHQGQTLKLNVTLKPETP